MTGGTGARGPHQPRARAVAEQRGYAFGLGSQRPMLSDPATASTYQVRDAAPDWRSCSAIWAPVQAARASRDQLVELVASVRADALCLHLNPAMELVQPDGDRDFRGCLDRLAELAASFPVPIVAKETGCGLSASVAARLRARGIRHVDVSGAGGTSWVALEKQRCEPPLRGAG